MPNELQELLRTGLKAAITRPSIHGYRPHPTQQQFHEATSKGRWFLGGNRSGKTVAGATEAVRALTGKDPFNKFPSPPIRGRGISVDRTQGIFKITLPEIAKWLPPSMLLRGSFEESFNKTELNLTLTNGSTMDFTTYEQDLDKHSGTSRHFCWFDEEPPEAIFNENMMRLVDTDGRWWITMTPVEGMTWMYDKFYKEIVEEGKNLGIDIITVVSDDNPYITTAAIEALLLTMSPEEREVRRRGQFGAHGRLIYPNFDKPEGSNIISEFVPPREWWRINAMDHGLRNPTAWLFAAIAPDGSIYIFDEYYQSDKLIPEHAEEVLKRELLYGEPMYRVGDPSIHNKNPVTGTSVQQEYFDRGLHIIEGNNDVRGGLARVRTYFGNTEIRPKLYIVGSKCPHLVSELRGYRFAKWASRKDEQAKEKKEEPEKKNDHACDALRYLVASRPDGDLGGPVIQTRAGLQAVSTLMPGERYAEDWNETDSYSSDMGYHDALGTEW